MIKVLMAAISLCAANALAARPNANDIAACLSGKSHGRTIVTQIPFDDLNEEDDYWRGYTATTAAFQGKSIGYAKRGAAEGIAFNRRVYPIAQASPLNLSRAQYDDLVKRGSVGVIQPSDWYWLKGKQQFVCIVTNKSMEKATPILFLLNTGKDKHVYVTVGAEQ